MFYVILKREHSIGENDMIHLRLLLTLFFIFLAANVNSSEVNANVLSILDKKHFIVSVSPFNYSTSFEDASTLNSNIAGEVGVNYNKFALTYSYFQFNDKDSSYKEQEYNELNIISNGMNLYFWISSKAMSNGFFTGLSYSEIKTSYSSTDVIYYEDDSDEDLNYKENTKSSMTSILLGYHWNIDKNGYFQFLYSRALHGSNDLQVSDRDYGYSKNVKNFGFEFAETKLKATVGLNF